MKRDNKTIIKMNEKTFFYHLLLSVIWLIKNIMIQDSRYFGLK